MGAAVELIDKDQQVARGDGKGEVLPVFVSVDPARDSVAQVKKYVAGELKFTFPWHRSQTLAFHLS